MRFAYIKTVLPFIVWLAIGIGAVLAAPSVGGYEGGSWKMVGKNGNIIVKEAKTLAPRQSGYMFGIYTVGSLCICCCCRYLRRQGCCCGCDCCHNSAPKC